jgi:Domain of unknown function (DUF1611_C) P-loop domain
MSSPGSVPIQTLFSRWTKTARAWSDVSSRFRKSWADRLRRQRCAPPGAEDAAHIGRAPQRAAAFVVCHEVGRATIEGYCDDAVPTLEQCIYLTSANGRLTNPGIRCVGIGLNTAGLCAEGRTRILGHVEDRLGLSCIDPVALGAAALIERLLGSS